MSTAVFLSLPVAAQEPVEGSMSEVAADSYDREQRYAYFFLEGVKQQELGHYAAAFDLFRHACEIKPDAAEVYFQLAGYYVDLKADTQVRKCFEHAVALAPGNDTYQERLAQFYITQREYDRAIATYEELYRNHRDRGDVLQLLLRLYAAQNNNEQMINTLNRMEVLEGGSEQITLTKVQVYEQQGEKGKVLRELRNLADTHPHDLNYRVMLGNWLLQNENVDAAYKEYKVVLKEEPENPLALASMVDFYRAKHQYDKVDALTASLLRSPHTEAYTKMTILRQAAQDMQRGSVDTTTVMRYFDEALSLPQENGDLYMLKASFEELIDMPQDSIGALYHQVLAIEPDNVVARLMLIQQAWEESAYEQVIDLCRPARLYNPEEMRFYYFQGLAHYQREEKEQALETFRLGVAQINQDSNPDMASDLYELMGDLLHEKGLDDEAFAAYDSCLQWKPDNVGCLNNYAYFLAIKGRDLAKAEQMSYQTIKAEPQNATYLDTYAWILHLQGREEEAKIYMEQTMRYDHEPTEEVLLHATTILGENYSLPKSEEQE